MFSAFSISTGSLSKIISFTAAAKTRIYLRSTISCKSKIVYVIFQKVVPISTSNIMLLSMCFYFRRTYVISVHQCEHSTQHINCHICMYSKIVAWLNECIQGKNCYRSNNVEIQLEYLKSLTCSGELRPEVYPQGNIY